MGKFIKFFLGILGGLAILAIAAVVIVPKVVDIQKYKPLLLQKVSEATGLQVSLGGDLHLSLFPWVGVSFQDLHLGNPAGFGDEDFVAVKSFEAHVKLIPLLSKEIQINSFIVNEPSIFLLKRKDGHANWEALSKSRTKSQQSSDTVTRKESTEPLLKSIEIDDFVISNGRLKFVDQQQKTQEEVTGLTLKLTDVSLVRPVSLNFSGVINEKPFAVTGTVGPVGVQPGNGILPFDLHISALDQLTAKIKGQLDNPADNLSYNVSCSTESFSPRKLLAALQIPLPVATGDPAALETMALDVTVAGTKKNLAVTDGHLNLDSSKLAFSTNIKSFVPLNLTFDGKLDSIDFDRYLPSTPEGTAGEGSTAGKGEKGQPATGTDYAPLRKIAIDSKVAVGKMKVKGGTLSNVQMHLVAKKGVFEFNPFAMELYGGNVASTATVNVQGPTPVTKLEARTTNVQVGPLLRDFTGKNVIEGNLVSNVALAMNGDTAMAVKKSLNGKGELLFTDGAIVGIDLAGMVRNVQASFGLAAATTEKPRTDFAELRVPFTIVNGQVNTPGTTMQSPLLRVSAAGDADLVTEKLNMKVEPRFVATLKGQGDTTERRGLMVPVLVRGTFSNPQFAPDLTALLQGQLPDAESVKKALEQELSPEKVLPKDQGTTIEQGIKNLIPQLKLQ